MANLTFLYQMFDIHSLKAQSHINLEEEFQFLLQGLKRKAFFSFLRIYFSVSCTPWTVNFVSSQRLVTK